MIWALGAIAGAIVGSFLATIVVRWPDSRSVIKGRSACDHCGTLLGARDLVPLVSAAIAGNRCRTCRKPIDSAHPAIELTCALIGSLAFALPLPTTAGAALALLGWLLVPMAWLDWRHFWLPDRLNLALAVAGLFLGGYLSSTSLLDRLIGGAAGFAALWIIARLYGQIRARRGLGLGDAKMLGAIGVWLGWERLPIVLLLAALIGIAIALIRPGSLRATQAIPFGSALAISAFGVAAGDGLMLI